MVVGLSKNMKHVKTPTAAKSGDHKCHNRREVKRFTEEAFQKINALIVLKKKSSDTQAPIVQ